MNKKNKSYSQLFNSKSFTGFAESYKKASPYLNIGYSWAGAVLIFTYLGVKLDERWDLKPWLTVTGAILGVLTGFYQLMKLLMQGKDKEI